jgi:hypothetical protein
MSGEYIWFDVFRLFCPEVQSPRGDWVRARLAQRSATDREILELCIKGGMILSRQGREYLERMRIKDGLPSTVMVQPNSGPLRGASYLTAGYWALGVPTALAFLYSNSTGAKDE